MVVVYFSLNSSALYDFLKVAKAGWPTWDLLVFFKQQCLRPLGYCAPNWLGSLLTYNVHSSPGRIQRVLQEVRRAVEDHVREGEEAVQSGLNFPPFLVTSRAGNAGTVLNEVGLDSPRKFSTQSCQ